MKKNPLCFNAIILGTLLFAAGTVHAAIVEVPDTYTSTTNEFVLESGTVTTNGNVIIFDGELTLTNNITPTSYDTTNLLATVQVYVVIDLFATLPNVNDYTNMQAAVFGLFDDGSDTVGTLYAVSGDSWVQLTNNAQPMAVTDGATNLITVILDYYTSPVVYNVSLASAPGSTQYVSQTLISPLEESLIDGYGVSGTGGLISTTSVSGDPAPLSSRVDFSIYATTNGAFRINLNTVGESGNGDLTVYAQIDNIWVQIGSVPSVGDGSNTYQFDVASALLQIGGSYLFKVVDEAGFTHFSDGAIEIKSIKMDAVQMNLTTLELWIDTEQFKRYEVLVSSDITTGWSVSPVEVYYNDAWSESKAYFQAPGTRTRIRVPKVVEVSGQPVKAFYKIRLLD